MVGHNADEGLFFTNPVTANESAFAGDLLASFPDVNPSVQTYIEEVLYPTVYDGRYFYFDRAYNNQTYAYEFSVPPALHGQDIPYTFFNGPR